MERSLGRVCEEAAQAVRSGCNILILSDREVTKEYAAIPSLLATSAVHHHLIREGLRLSTGIVVESGEPREVMHFALLIGYGAAAINPYLAFETLEDQTANGMIPGINGVEEELGGLAYTTRNMKYCDYTDRLTSRTVARTAKIVWMLEGFTNGGGKVKIIYGILAA